jgi:solute:Na+ symporter, SSS family
MLLGGGTTIALVLLGWGLPLGLDANIGGISVSAIVFVTLSLWGREVKPENRRGAAA